jgi:exopolyphosphatase/guanosine-5'-triphosphate,3'-diphosphate pyrophosphatase
VKRASIDLGTNTCLLLIQEVTSSGEEIILHDESQVVRLGEGVDLAGELNPEAMERARACLGIYAQTAKRFGVEPGAILAVGTAQARDAKNASQFFASIQRELGIQFRVLSGDEEARATFLGAALPGIPSSLMAVMDIGGGSTEIVALPDSTGSILGESLNIGAVRMTERWLKSDPVTDSEFWKCEEEINEALLKLKPWRKSLRQRLGGREPIFVAVAGTAVTLAMLEQSISVYERTAIDGLRLTVGDAHRLVEELKWRTVGERKRMIGMEPKRADVILAGAMIFWRAMEELEFKELRISTRGLRYGVFSLQN